jgi:hypothetical protein
MLCRDIKRWTRRDLCGRGAGKNYRSYLRTAANDAGNALELTYLED